MAKVELERERYMMWKKEADQLNKKKIRNEQLTFDVVLIRCASSWSETVRKSLIISRLGFGFPLDYTAVGLPRITGLLKKKIEKIFI